MPTVTSKLCCFIIFTVLLVSCRKETGSAPGDTPPLKMVKKVSASAFDYMQYEYNANGNVTGYITQWKDAAGNLLRQNNVFEYNTGNQLVKWTNEAGYGLYSYQNGRLSQSVHYAANGKKLSTIRYSFDAIKRLFTVVEEIENAENTPKQSRLSYQYYNNGNIRRIDLAFRYEITDPFTLYFSKKFIQYDNKKNPEPDGIIGAFLPGVIQQHNNPLYIENIMADGTVQGYTRYEYNYNMDGFPVQRKMSVTINNTEQPPVIFTYEY